MSQRIDVHEQITNRIIAAIEQGAGEFKLPWHRPAGSITRPVNIQSGKGYRGINVVTLWVEERRCAGARCRCGERTSSTRKRMPGPQGREGIARRLLQGTGVRTRAEKPGTRKTDVISLAGARLLGVQRRAMRRLRVAREATRCRHRPQRAGRELHGGDKDRGSPGRTLGVLPAVRGLHPNAGRGVCSPAPTRRRRRKRSTPLCYTRFTRPATSRASTGTSQGRFGTTEGAQRGRTGRRTWGGFPVCRPRRDTDAFVTITRTTSRIGSKS